MTSTANHIDAINSTSPLQSKCDRSGGGGRMRSIMSDCRATSLLHKVQMARIFADSKTFVDMTIKRANISPNGILMRFDDLMANTGGEPDRKTLARFVEDHFTLENQLEEFEPQDWTDEPSILEVISDPDYRQFARELNATWKILGRKMSPLVAANPDRYTLIPLPNPVVVPGGRFREVYYWDSYWIIRGLLLCDMGDTVRGMLENFVHFIDKLGKIPNGGRTYFENRSQPPLFIQMVEEYVEATGDMEFVRENISQMRQEFEYWTSEHFMTVTLADGSEHRLARYISQDEVDGPRPESYFEDFDLASGLNEEDRTRLYTEMKSGAESGWDYSTRWMVSATEGSSGATSKLEDTKATCILPVELNSFLHKNAVLLAKYHIALGYEEAGMRYEAIADNLCRAVNQVLWNEEDGIWYDYDTLNGEQRRHFFPSNLAPLWTNTMEEDNESEQMKRATQYVLRQDLDTYPGGVPTSLVKSGQQWDFPNCWPPIEHILVQGLEATGLPDAREAAFKIAERRVRGCYVNHKAKGHMFEKYDASSLRKIGGGGEYDIQIGFGWTNSVVLDFLNMYGDRLVVAKEDEESRKTSTGSRQP